MTRNTALAAPAFIFRGEPKTFRTNREVIFDVFSIFARRDPTFCERCAPGDVRLERRKGNLSDKHRKSARELPGEWWLSTGGSANDIERRIRRACRFAGVRYGEELIVHLRTL